MKTVLPARTPLFPLLLVLSLTVGMALGVGSRYYFTHSAKDSVWSVLLSGDPAAQFSGKKQINVLVMGIDDNWTNKDMVYTRGARTDTLFAVNLDLRTRKVHMVSIPRDSRVRIAGTGRWGKINGAYATGGAERSRKTVQQFLGVPIDHYVVLKIDATKKLVDSIGGVDLNVEKDMDYDDNWGHLHIHLKKGPQHLDGEAAVGYIRFRHDSDGDFGRIRRQQQLLHTIAKKLKNPMMMAHMGAVVDAFKQSVTTDLNNGQVFALAQLFKGVDTSQIVSSFIPGTDQRVGGVWFLVPDVKKKQLIVDWLLKNKPEAQIPLVQVLVENGCGDKAATAAVCKRLRLIGFQATLGAASYPSDYPTTQVVDYDRLKGSGALIVSKLGLTTPARIHPDPQADTHVEVIVGHDLSDDALASRAPDNQ